MIPCNLAITMYKLTLPVTIPRKHFNSAFHNSPTNKLFDTCNPAFPSARHLVRPGGPAYSLSNPVLLTRWTGEHACMNAHMPTCTCTYIPMYKCLHVCSCVYVPVCTCLHAYVCLHIGSYEALRWLNYTSGSQCLKRSSANIFHCDHLNLGVKTTARMRAFRIYHIWPHLKPFSKSKSGFTAQKCLKMPFF